MGSIVKKISVNASPEKLWEIWKDVERTPKWVEGVQESQITSGAKEGVGLSWREGCIFGSLPVQMDHEILEWEPAKKTVVHTGLPMGGTIKRTTEWVSIENGCEVSAEFELNLGMAGAFVGEEKARAIIEENLELTLENWKNLAEDM